MTLQSSVKNNEIKNNEIKNTQCDKCKKIIKEQIYKFREGIFTHKNC